MMSVLYKVEGAQMRIDIIKEKKVQDFINTHAGILDSSFEKVEMSDSMRKSLKHSDYVFSGLKSSHK